ncbi:hypothetical protein CNR22_22740 [Sphingobacteriaceae bacterium]|nr:hypothetical protein CNR22_22740 [Sphingobacteriaceae bacterium]
MTKTFQISLVLAGLCTVLFTNCSKKENQEVDNETQSVVDYAIIDQEFLSIVPAIYQSLQATNGTGAATTPTVFTCDTLSYVSGDTSTFSPNVVYSLNTSGTTCGMIMPDGKTRTGKLTIRLNGKVKKDSKIIVKLVNYTSENISYTCDSLVLTTLEMNTSSPSFNVTLINGRCTSGTATIKYSFNRTFVIYPNGDSNADGAVIHVFGDAFGTNRQGTNFSTSVSQQESLLKHKTCRYIDKGLMELTPEGFKTRTIDFGNGTCDDEATFTVKENTVAFKLK